MKRYITLFALVAGFQIAFAQKPDTAQVLVHYKFSHVRDTNNRAHPYMENMALFVGKSASSYKSYDTQLQNELYRQQFQELLLNSPGGNFRLDRKITGSGTEYYQFVNDKRLARKEVLANTPYIMTDALPVIAWHITSSTANFAELHCQKATCHFKGRDYTAWFCPDLPMHVGPWKLNGLPGVIVEAYDAKKEVVFKFDKVERAVLGTRKPIKNRAGRIVEVLGDEDGDIDPNIIQIPARGVKTTEKALEKLQSAMMKDPNAFAQASSQGDGPKMDRKAGVAPILNNPIELPEKK